MWFELFVVVTAVIAAAVASVTGFGIGSLLTPTVGLVTGTKIAVAAVSLPHFVGTAIRFWMLRDSVDRKVLWRFGLPSAAGGLAGAFLYSQLTSPWLTIVFGVLLLFVAASELTGLTKRLRFHGAVASVAGVLSGTLGGLVGNQGGIRSAALLGFDLPKRTFVATATAVGLVVDGARLPIYLFVSGRDVLALWPTLLVATTGVIIGTFAGARALRKIPEPTFRPFLAVVLALLGAAMLFRGFKA